MIIRTNALSLREARTLLLQMTEFSADTWDQREDFYGQCRKWAAES